MNVIKRDVQFKHKQKRSRNDRLVTSSLTKYHIGSPSGSRGISSKGRNCLSSEFFTYLFNSESQTNSASASESVTENCVDKLSSPENSSDFASKARDDSAAAENELKEMLNSVCIGCETTESSSCEASPSGDAFSEILSSSFSHPESCEKFSGAKPKIFSRVTESKSRFEFISDSTHTSSSTFFAGFTVRGSSSATGSTTTPKRNKTPIRQMSARFSKTPNTGSSKSPRSIASGRNNSTKQIAGSSFVLAVTEGRGQARGEVGIAAMDPLRPHLTLCQISDSQRYIHSLTKMNVFNIEEVIIPNTFFEGQSPSKLYNDIHEHFPNITMTSVQRRHFNEAIGLEFIRQYRSPESESVMILLRDKFYALSAAAALTKYVEFTRNVIFTPRSIKVDYEGTENTMIIDLNTANKLELVASASDSDANSKNTLFGVLNHCQTRGGIRLLRANILQPSCCSRKIEIRLDCVAELTEKPLLFYEIEAAVSGFSNVENCLGFCMHLPRQNGLRAAEHQLKYVLLLKTTLELVPTLIGALEQTHSDYFCEVREGLSDVRYKMIMDRILQTVSENAKSVKGSVAAHLHACFAIKTGINGLLDVAKKTYCEIIQEIWDHVTEVREKSNLPLRMSFSAQRGFHIQYSCSTGEKKMGGSAFPKEFILIQKIRSTYIFYTSELVALDQRSQQVLNEIKLMTNVILFELLNDIRSHIGCLFNLCEYVAELDVILSFSRVSSGKNYVRPIFSNVLDLKNSRHPILDVIHDGKIVPNDIFAGNERNCTILTGPNQSGKSIYIGQIALLQIMAQVGCFVPAEEATFRITDRVFSRIGADDSVETNASALITEMRDIEYLRQNITSDSLIVIDELCGSTSVEEGTSLAFVICEELLDSTAFVFLTTHYMSLGKLEEMYHSVKKLEGITEAEQYGLQIAQITCFPSDIIANAREISGRLMRQRKLEEKIPFPFGRIRTEQSVIERLAQRIRLKYRRMKKKSNKYPKSKDYHGP